MQTKIIFISDNFDHYHNFIRKKNAFEYSLDLLTHAEANKQMIYNKFYDLFIIDIREPWLAIPQWIREQAQHRYYFQFIFITNASLNAELSNLLNEKVFKVVSKKEAVESLSDYVDEAKINSNEQRYKPEASVIKNNRKIVGMLGNHPAIKKTNEFIQIVSRARFAPCLIRGETGTGKNLCGRLIHRANDLKEDLFFTKNCEEATTNELLGDLLGVENTNDVYGPVRKGLFKLYSNGTLVLKNIEYLSPEVQEKLLLFLDSRIFKPLGGNRPIEANIRIIGTTQQNLEWFVKHKGFNSGLFYHLNAFEIFLPPLRDRIEDLPVLAKYYRQYYNNHFAKRVKEITPTAMNLLKKHTWPGNISELRDIIGRAIFRSTSPQITVSELSEISKTNGQSSPTENYIGNCSIKEIEKIHIQHVLERTNGNKSKAANILSISRTTLREKLRTYGLAN